MTTAGLTELENALENAALAIARNPKEKPKTILKYGLPYYKAAMAVELNKVSKVTQVASLYSSGQREEILRDILPPISKVVALDIEFKSKAELKELTDTLAKRNKDIEELIHRCTATENMLADLKDELAAKEKPLLVKAAQQEYALKRKP